MDIKLDILRLKLKIDYVIDINHTNIDANRVE